MNEAYAGFRAESLGKRTYAVTYALTAPAFKIRTVSRAAHLRETDCVAGVAGLELRNVDANYPFESSRGFPGSEPTSGQGDHPRLSCSGGDTQSSGLGSAGIFSKRSARTLAIMRRRPYYVMAQRAGRAGVERVPLAGHHHLTDAPRLCRQTRRYRRVRNDRD